MLSLIEFFQVISKLHLWISVFRMDTSIHGTGILVVMMAFWFYHELLCLLQWIDRVEIPNSTLSIADLTFYQIYIELYNSMKFQLQDDYIFDIYFNVVKILVETPKTNKSTRLPIYRFYLWYFYHANNISNTTSYIALWSSYSILFPIFYESFLGMSNYSYKKIRLIHLI